MSNQYTVKIKNKQEIAKNTLAVYLDKPADFKFKAGQFIKMSLINPPITDEKGTTRDFSIASAPHEPDILVATKVSDSAFKKVLKDLEPGTKVEINGPYGSFTLHNDPSYYAVFLVGGIGITPVRSIVLDAMHRKLLHKIVLLYSNRRPEDSAFLDELQKLSHDNENFKLLATMTQMEQSKKEWSGHQGYIDKKMIEENIPDIKKSIFYLVGPSAMVSAMRQLLEQMEVNDLQIKIEEFGGY